MSNTVDRLAGASSSLAFKSPCRLGTTANITLSGFQTIDGTLPTSTEHVDLRRILVKDQTDAAENGIYIMDTGAWQRAKDFDGNNDFRQGTRMYVYGGSTQSGTYIVTSSMDPSSFEFDEDNITIAEVGTFDQTTSAIGLTSGGVISWNSGDVTITHAANTLAFGGASSGYFFDSNISVSSALVVSGAVTLSSAVFMNGAVAASSAVTMSGAVSLTSAVSMSGTVTLSSAATVTANAPIASTAINASGAISVANSIAASSAVSAAALKIGATTGAEVAIFGATAVTALTSASTGTTVPFGGYATFTDASSLTYSVAAPAPGRSVHIQNVTTSTGSTSSFTLASGTIITSTQSVATTVRIGGGGGVTLHGLTTAVATIMPFSTAATNASLA